MIHGCFTHPAGVAVLPRQFGGSAGFTLVELVMVIVITGILAAFVAPRFTQDNVFAARGFSDQVKATLRYAQKSAVAQHRYACVAFSTSSITVSVSAVPSCPGLALASADGNLTTRVQASRDVAFTVIPADFYFDPLGSPMPAGARRLQVAGVSRAVLVEAETGYVH